MRVYNITLLDDESDITLKELPVKFIHKDSKLLGKLAVFAGGACALAPIVFFLSTVINNGPVNKTLPILAVSLLFLPIFVIGLNITKRKKETVISRDMVSKLNATLFKKDQWQEPVSSYTGILLRTDVQPAGEQSSELIYALDLLHEDNDKTIRLFKCKEYNAAFNKWKEYCQLFETTPLERTGKENIIHRSLNEIGKPLVDIIKEDPKLIHPEPPEVPAEIEISDTPKGKLITLPNKTQISLGQYAFTINQQKSWKNETSYEYTAVRTVLIDYSKQADKWAWAIVIVERDSSHRMIYAHNLQYKILNWLQYYLFNQIIKRSED